MTLMYSKKIILNKNTRHENSTQNTAQKLEENELKIISYKVIESDIFILLLSINV